MKRNKVVIFKDAESLDCAWEIEKYLSPKQFITNYINNVKKIKCFITKGLQQHIPYVVICIVTTKDDQTFNHRICVSSTSYEDAERLVDKSIPNSKIKIAVIKPTNKRDISRRYRILIK